MHHACTRLHLPLPPRGAHAPCRPFPAPCSCFDTKHTPPELLECSPKLTDTLTYTQVGGIIAGQLVSLPD